MQITYNIWYLFIKDLCIRSKSPIFPARSFLKISDSEKAREFGIHDTPGLIYFENRIPSLYDGDLLDEEALLEWLVEQKTTDTVEVVTDEILARLAEEEEYLAVFFSGPCEEDDPCQAVLDMLRESTDRYKIQ